MRRASLLLLVLAACGTAAKITETTPDRTPEAEQKYKEAVARGEVRIGMVQSEVRAAMGPPSRTSRTTYRRKPSLCWSYLYTDVYFDGQGFVIGWQSALGG